MAEENEETQETQVQTPQKELERIWKDPQKWNDGPRKEIDLPEGMRLIWGGDLYILRSMMQGTPSTMNGTQTIEDVPIAVFGERYNPQEVKKEARRWIKLIASGQVKYHPTELNESNHG